MEEKSRNSGIDVVGKIKWGTHFCQFFQTEQDFTDIVIPYIATGLENNEFCVWILPDIPASEEKKKALKKIPHIDTYLEKEQIEIIPFSGFHLKENLLKSKGTLNFWNKKLEKALNRGYSGLRVIENNRFQEKNSNYEKESWNDLLDYEENLNFFVNEDKEHKILFLCTYELGLCSPVEIIELSKIHHFVLAKKQEKWKLLETSIQRNRAERFQAEEKLEGKKLEKGKIEPEKGCQNIKELHNAEKEMHNGYKEIQAQSEKLQTFKGFNEEFQLKSEERQAQAEELKDAYEELGKSEKRYRMLFTNMSEGFLLGEPLYDEKGRSYDYRFLEVNPAFELNTGLKREEILGRTIRAVLKNPSSLAIEKYGEVAHSGEPAYVEIFSQELNRYLDNYIFCPEKGKFATIFRDVTERKKMEIAMKKQEEHLEDLLKSIQDGFFELDKDWKFTYINRRASENVGFKPEELIGECIWKKFPWTPGSKYETGFKQVMEARKPFSFEVESTAGERWYEINAYPSGSGISVFWMEITERKKAEKALFGAYERIQAQSGELQAYNEELQVQTEELEAQAEELQETNKALHESKEKLRLLGDNLPDSAIYQYMHESDGRVRFLYCSAGIEQLNGVSSENVLRDPSVLHSQIPQPYYDRLVEAEAQSAKELSYFDMEIPMYRPDGQVRWMRLHSHPRILPDCRIVWDGVQTDITSRKQAEEALQKAYAEIQSKSLELQASNEELEVQAEELQAQAEELKTAYEALSESENRYRLLFAHSMDAIIVVDPRENGKILSANPAACQMLGWSEEELKGKGRDILLDLEDPALSSLLEERLRSGSARVELVYKRKNGTRFIGEISTALFEDIGGELRAVVIIRDVTERKKTEEALSRERSLLGSVMQTTDFMLVFFDPQFNFVWVNPAYAESCQMKPEELIGKNHFELYPDAENEAIFRKVRDTGESVFYKDKPFIYSDQPERGITYWDWNLAPVKDSRGNVTGLVLSLRETTKYKLAEGALRKSEDRYRMLFTNMNEGFGLLECIYDEKGIPYNYRYLEINPAFKLYLGVKRGEILGKNMLELFPNSSPIALKNYKEVAISGKPANFEIFSDVAKKYLEIYVFSPAKGKIALILRDISERKRLEEQIRQRAEEVETVMKVAPAAIWIGHDPQCHNITGNQMANEFYEAEDGENVSANITPVRRFFFEGHELAADELPMQESVLKDTDIKNVEFDVLLPSGKWRTLLGSASPLHDAEGMVRGSVGTFMDITGRKQAEKALNLAYEQIQIQSEELQVQNEELQDQSEKLKEINEALRESEERYRTLFSTMDQGFCIIEMLFDENQKPIDYLFVETNPAFERHTGLENVVGKRIQELAPENEEYWYEIYGKVALTGESVRFEDRAKALNRWYEVYAYRIDKPESRKVAILFNDITERKQMEEALKKAHEDLEEKVKERTKQLAKAYKSLKESERGLAEAQKMAHIGNWDWNLLTGEIHWSDEKYRIFGLKPRELELTYDLFLRYIHPEDKDYLDKLNKRACKGEPYTADFRIISADGIERILHEQCEVIFDEKNIPVRIQGTTQDITERKKTEKALAELETARLKEIHHRIKNNLQVISSLLDLQAENLNNKADLTHSEILEAFRESQDRVASIALIHEELYAGKGTDSLNFSLYLQKLVKSLFQTYRVGSANIGLKLDLPENIFFDMDNAIPLGIIVNELVSNSLKHAFPGRDRGEIKIKILREKDFSERSAKAGVEGNNEENNIRENKAAGEKKIEKVERAEKAQKPGINNTGINETLRINYTLMVSDNGVGIPENLDLENSETLGLQLVSILTEQLDGKLELKRSPGSQFILNFSLSEG